MSINRLLSQLAAKISGGVLGRAGGGTGTAVIPAFSYYQSASQSLGSNLFVKLTCDTKEFDTDSLYDNVTNFYFKPTTPGYYLLSANIQITNSATLCVSLFKNGAEFKRGNYAQTNGSSFTVTALVYMNGTTDYVYPAVFSAVTNTTQIVTPYMCYFQGVFVRTT